MKTNYSQLTFIDFYKKIRSSGFSEEDFYSAEFVNKVCSYKSPMKFRLLLYALEGKTDLSIYESIYRKYILLALTNGGIKKEFNELIGLYGKKKDGSYTKYIDCFDGTRGNMFLQLLEDDSIDSYKSYIIKETNNRVVDMISEYLFSDLFNNIIIDCEQIIKYNSKFNLILPDHIKFYEEFKDLGSYAFSDKIEFFKRYMCINVKEMLYDDIRLLKDKANSDLSKSCIKLDEKLVDKKLSKEYGVKVYKYNGQPFRGVFRVANAYREYYNPDLFANMMCENGFAFSFSYCDSNHFWLYGNPEEKYTFFYDELDPNTVIHMSRTDSFSEARKPSVYVSKYPNEILAPNEMINGSFGYNELVLKTNGGLRPSAIVLVDTTEQEKECKKLLEKYGNNTFYTDSISRNYKRFVSARENTIRFAQEHNIPIMLVSMKKYNTTYTGKIEDYVYSPQARYGNYLTDYSQIEVFNYLGRRK